MVTTRRFAWGPLALLAACGPGLHPGDYAGEPRFTVRGSIASLAPASAPAYVTVLWQIVVAAPPPCPSGAVCAAQGGIPGDSSSPPQGNFTPALDQDTAVGSVTYPAPYSLPILDLPTTSYQWTALLALGTIVVFADIDRNGLYSVGTDPIIGATVSTRLLYTTLGPQSPPRYGLRHGTAPSRVHACHGASRVGHFALGGDRRRSGHRGYRGSAVNFVKAAE